MNKEIPPYKTLETMGILAAASIFFGLVFRLRGLFSFALAFLVMGLLAKGPAKQVARGWLKFAEVVGGINSRIILTLLFYLFLTPLAFVFRMTHGDFLRLNREERAASYFTVRKHRYGPKDLTNPW